MSRLHFFENPIPLRIDFNYLFEFFRLLSKFFSLLFQLQATRFQFAEQDLQPERFFPKDSLSVF
jgi:hypothetical protein